MPNGSQSEFHAVFSDVGAQDAFYRFLQNIYRLYPEDRFHELIKRLCTQHTNDEAIYRAIQRELPAIKAVYGWLIKKATKASYEEASPVTAVVLDRAPTLPTVPALDIKPIAEHAGGTATLAVPRYAAFKEHAVGLASQGVNFREVAGNGESAAILITVVVASGWQVPHERARIVFTQPILTRPERARVAFAVPVGALAELLRRLQATGVQVEHIYDY